MRGSQGAVDHFHHRVELLQDIGIPKAKYLVPLALKQLRPSSIILGRLCVLTSIEFDHHATLHTTEIRDEGWNRVLPAKFSPSALPAAQAMPQPTLSIGLIAAEATSVYGQPRHDSEVVSPSP